MVYVQIGNDDYVIGYSSNQMHESDLIYKSEELEDKFFNLPMFYKIVENKLVFDEVKYEEFKTEKANRLTSEQKLGQKCSDLEIQVMMLQQMLMKQ